MVPGEAMFEHGRGLFVLLSISFLSTSARSAELTLVDGSAYAALEVLTFDTEEGVFLLEKKGTRIALPVNQVSTLDLRGQIGSLQLREGSVYRNLEIVQFDVPKNRLTVRRSDKVLNLPLSDVARVELDLSNEFSKAGPIEPATHAGTLMEATQDIESATPWQEEGLYSNLPEGFGEKSVGGNTPIGYTPRWKTDSPPSSTNETAAKQSEKPKHPASSRANRRATVEEPPRENRRQTRALERKAAHEGGDRRGSRENRRSGSQGLSGLDDGQEMNETDFGSPSGDN